MTVGDASRVFVRSRDEVFFQAAKLAFPVCLAPLNVTGRASRAEPCGDGVGMGKWTNQILSA